MVATACGGGGGGGGSDPAAPVTVTAVVIDPTSASGYAVGATVCLDANNDGQCGSSELSTTTDADGKVQVTLDAAAQSAFAGARVIALVDGTLPDTLTGAPVPVRFMQAAAPWAVTTTRVVLSPLSTWVEQLVLATMPRATARTSVAELAGLATLTVDDDFVATPSAASDPERQRALDSALAAWPNQTAAAMQVLRNPAASYAESFVGDGVWRIFGVVPGATPGLNSGRVGVFGLDTENFGTPRWASATWRFDGVTLNDYDPQDTVPALLDGLGVGPLRPPTGTSWVAAPSNQTVERVGARVFRAILGTRTALEVRSATSLEGQPVGPLLPNAVLAAPAFFPSGALQFDTVVQVALESWISTTDALPRNEASGATVTANPSFTSFDEFRAWYSTAANRWFDIGIGEQIAFDADGVAVYRNALFDPFNPVPHGIGAVERLNVLGAEVIRLVLPDPAIEATGFSTFDVAVPDGLLRQAIVQRRGELRAAPSRSVNRAAANAMWGALGWPVPPGAP